MKIPCEYVVGKVSKKGWIIQIDSFQHVSTGSLGMPVFHRAHKCIIREAIGTMVMVDIGDVKITGDDESSFGLECTLQNIDNAIRGLQR